MRHIIRLFLLTLLTFTSTPAAESVYLVIDGIEGEVVQKGREGWVEVFGFNHEIVSPRDAASGLPTGKRQHQPIRFVIPHGKTLPLLMRALTQQTPVPKIAVNFFRLNQQGVETLYMKYELTNASVVSVRPWMPNIKDPSTREFGPQVEVAFVYHKIVWTFTDGGITHEDDWETPR